MRRSGDPWAEGTNHEAKWERPEIIGLLWPQEARTRPKERSSSRLSWKSTTSVALTTEPLPRPHVRNEITWENPANTITILIRIMAVYCALRATTRESLGRSWGNEYVPQRVKTQRGRIRLGYGKMNSNHYTRKSFWCHCFSHCPRPRWHSDTVLIGSLGLFIAPALRKGSRSGEGGKSESGELPCHVLSRSCSLPQGGLPPACRIIRVPPLRGQGYSGLLGTVSHIGPEGHPRKLSGLEKLDKGPNSYKKHHINKMEECSVSKKRKLKLCSPLYSWNIHTANLRDTK